MDINIRIAGEAGQGVQTTGNLLVGAFARLGLGVLATQSYMSRIRGGLNWFDVRVADGELFGSREKADLLVALTADALEILGEDVSPGAVVLYDGESAEGAVAIDLTQAAKDAGGKAVMANTVAAGAVFTILGYDCDVLCDYLDEQFARKGADVAELNAACARKGAELAGPHAGKLAAPEPAGAPPTVCNGAEAIALAAATAGVKFFAAYPMTPATAVFTWLAAAADEYGIVVEQAEDEIAAVNMVCGAAYAGAVAMTGTSGGGFALMTEGLSLAGIMELPIVIMIAQRPGPATGLPTRTGQQDLLFALHAGHGEFVRAIYAPGTPRQCFELTRRALATAHRFQTPVIILTDQYLQDTQKNIPPLDRAARPIDRRIVSDAGADYRRYALAANGVSPRAIPGGEALVVADSDEHDESGHITEDLDTHLAQQDKRMAKGAGLLAEAIPPELYGPEAPEILLICWGSSYGPCREAVDLLNAADGAATAMLHFGQVWPVQVGGAGSAAIDAAGRIVCIEGNCTGQFASVLAEQGVLTERELALRYDGLPLTAEWIVGRVRT